MNSSTCLMFVIYAHFSYLTMCKKCRLWSFIDFLPVYLHVYSGNVYCSFDFKRKVLIYNHKNVQKIDIGMLSKACNAQAIHIRTCLYKIIVFKKADIFLFQAGNLLSLNHSYFPEIFEIWTGFWTILYWRVDLNIISRMFICFIILSLQTNLQNISSHQIICPRSFPVTSVVVPLSYLLSS